MGNRGNNPQMQFSMMVPLTPVVKWLIGINVAVWVFLQIILEGYVLHEPLITTVFGLIPENLIQRFYVWEVVTYMFLHARNVFHIVFNMLLLWWLGSELEQRWGSKFFLAYYMVSGVGAAVIYAVVALVITLFHGPTMAWTVPVVGASGALFGLMLAYGIIFGERIMYFMMVFPMRAKYFVVILGAVEVATLLNNGLSGDVANLAHLGGIASGFIFLKVHTRLQQKRWRKKSDPRGRGLKLVINNEKKDEKGDGNSGPRYWN